MILVLEIEYLLGVAFAARANDREAPDWPPQPDRVFSALTAAWAARDKRSNERRALEWLEVQSVPELSASGGLARTARTVFVPPNDNEISERALSSKWFNFLERGEMPSEKGGHKKQWQKALGVVPQWRSRTERQFPAYRPDDPVVRVI
jgi:CRISPR-associated protein Csb2